MTIISSARLRQWWPKPNPDQLRLIKHAENCEQWAGVAVLSSNKLAVLYYGNENAAITDGAARLREEV